MSQVPGITHIALIVTNLPRSTAWYAALFGLHKHQDEVGTPFDGRSPGLDHVAFNCADRTELERWGSRLDELGVSHRGIIDARYGSGLAFRDPDGIALEFFTPPS